MLSTHLKNINQIGSFPSNRDENKKCFKPPPSNRWLNPFGKIFFKLDHFSQGLGKNISKLRNNHGKSAAFACQRPRRIKQGRSHSGKRWKKVVEIVTTASMLVYTCLYTYIYQIQRYLLRTGWLHSMLSSPPFKSRNGIWSWMNQNKFHE